MSRYVEKENTVYIYFDNKPEKLLREYLKQNKWHWNSYDKCWEHINESKTALYAMLIVAVSKVGVDNIDQLIDRLLDEYKESITLSWNNSIYVIEDINKYHKYHLLAYYSANINVCDRTGYKQIQITPIIYCNNCDRYYIMQDDYNELCRDNRFPMARFFTHKKNFDEFREESPLKFFGYSVSQKDNLSPQQRHEILRIIYEEGIMPKDIIISYLSSFIRSHTNEHYEIAREKWQDDIGYIKKYL